ncbi:unnamed protein product, partial [Hapterophycus canaliculatus]
DEQDLVRRLLTVDPKTRLTAAEACEHPWLSTPREKIAKHNLEASLENLKIFNAVRKLRAAIKSVRGARSVEPKKMKSGRV